jgi:hypothetical protein
MGSLNPETFVRFLQVKVQRRIPSVDDSMPTAGLNENDQHEILGLKTAFKETGDGWCWP